MSIRSRLKLTEIPECFRSRNEAGTGCGLLRTWLLQLEQGAANPGCRRLSGGIWARRKARRGQNCPPHFISIGGLRKSRKWSRQERNNLKNALFNPPCLL
jgi:hypothetical protein